MLGSIKHFLKLEGSCGVYVLSFVFHVFKTPDDSSLSLQNVEHPSQGSTDLLMGAGL